jgi:hypothetical protein
MVLVTITNNMSIMMKSLHIEEAGSSKNACDQYCKHKEKYPQRKFKYGGGKRKVCICIVVSGAF